MISNFKIVIPQPCNEDWDKMIPNETGRFCQVCNKSVIDFTSKLPQEIQHFFYVKQNQKICGRFKNSQLDSVTIQIPSQVLFSQNQYHKIFILALFVVMGTSLFSCATINGDKQKIDSITIIDEKSTNTRVLIPDITPKNTFRNEQYRAIDTSKQKNTNKEYEELILMGDASNTVPLRLRQNESR